MLAPNPRAAAPSAPPSRALVIWLLVCCAMIFAMAIIGAITRLTESGLSITEWQPVKGALPPLNDAAWEHAFSLYKATPQYHAINAGMTLPEFKNIFFWEWLHRLWGRLIGLVYALPLLVFWPRGKIPAGFKLPLIVGLLLGGLQGLVGWIMVKSGLQPGMAAVDAGKLAMHLDLALFVYCFLLWQVMRLKAMPLLSATSFCLKRHAVITLFLAAVTITWGALTAGLDAGKIYNTFPLMNGAFLPSDALAQEPWWRNFLHNPAAVQFAHRWLAIGTAFTAIALGLRLHKRGAAKIGGALIALPLLQLMLGIATLLSGVDIVLAVLHQGNAILVLSAALAGVFVALRKETLINK